MGQVLCVDSNAVFRLGIRALVSECQPALRIVELETFAGVRHLLKNCADASLILLDIATPDCGGFIGLFELCREFPGVPIIVVSESGDTKTIRRAVALGAAGFISRLEPCETIADTLNEVLSNGCCNSVPVATNDDHANAIAALSPAQLRVLRGLKRGLRNKEIAFELGLTEKTVKAYMSSLYRKLGVRSRTEALILFQDTALGLQ